MAITFDIDPHKRLITVRVEGVLRSEDIAAARRAVTSSPEFRADFGQIMDLTGVERVDLRTEEIRELAKSTPFVPGARRVMVAPSDLLYGLGRLFEITGGTEGWQIHVCHTLAEAQAWLDTGDEQ